MQKKLTKLSNYFDKKKTLVNQDQDKTSAA